VLEDHFPERLGRALNDGLAATLDGPRSLTFQLGFESLRRHLPFDGGWWGLVEPPATSDMAVAVHLFGTVDLAADFQQSYAEIYREDVFAAAVFANPGHVLRWSGPETEEKPASVLAWVRKHRLEHCVTVSSREPFSGQLFIICLYRFDGGVPFSDADAMLLRYSSAQMAMLWRRNLQDMFDAASAESLSATLLAKSDGELLFCGAHMAARLSAAGWEPQGRRVPASWLQFGAGNGGRLRLGDDWAVINDDGELLRAELASAGQAPALPARLLRVAALFCDGLTAKQISRELDLAPATVRTYLSEAYLQLGVHNKLELHAAIRRGLQPRRD
jgi:DNA-binding CsgD family transcriptional regulator